MLHNMDLDTITAALHLTPSAHRESSKRKYMAKICIEYDRYMAQLPFGSYNLTDHRFRHPAAVLKTSDDQPAYMMSQGRLQQ